MFEMNNRTSSHSEDGGERQVLSIALTLNAIMFAVGLLAGIVAQSSGLIADSLDMLADAMAYAIDLIAIGRSQKFKVSAGRFSGIILFVLGAGVLCDVARRIVVGSEPLGVVMMATATVSLVVNTAVLRMLGRFRQGEVHLRTAWIFTRVDVIVNASVILSGFLVVVTKLAFLDLLIGAIIGLYVCKEATEIFRESSKSKEQESG